MNTYTFMGLRKSSDLKQGFRDCPGGPLLRLFRGTWVQSLVRGTVDPMLQLKYPHASQLKILDAVLRPVQPKK